MSLRVNNGTASLNFAGQGINKTYAPYDPDNLVLVYDTRKEPDNLQVSVPLNGTVNCTIDWGDGTKDSYTTTGFKTHTYIKGGVYVVQISGTMTQLNYGTGATNNNRAKLRRCLSFGSVGLTSLNRGFRDCQNLIQCPTSLPAGVTTLQECFYGCAAFNDSRIGAWNTAAVTSMIYMFYNCTSFNADLSAWNTAAVTNMSNMFRGCTSFSADLSAWNTAAVTNMSVMFYNCTSFNSDLSAWNTALVTNMNNMFYNCDSFTSNLGNWDLSALNSISSIDSFMNLATGLSTADYDATLIGWESDKASYRSDLRPNFGGSKYTSGSAADAARQSLVSYGWTITDGGPA